MKKGFGRHYPIMLEDKSYNSIYNIIEKKGYVEYISDKYVLTEKGKRELERLGEKVNVRKFNWFAEGL